LKLHRLQNKVLRTTVTFPKRTSVRDLHMTFNLPYVYDYVIKLCRQLAEVIRNHENANIYNIAERKAHHRKYTRLKFGGGQEYYRSRLPL
jgi:hypothetical protein